MDNLKNSDYLSNLKKMYLLGVFNANYTKINKLNLNVLPKKSDIENLMFDIINFYQDKYQSYNNKNTEKKTLEEFITDKNYDISLDLFITNSYKTQIMQINDNNDLVFGFGLTKAVENGCVINQTIIDILPDGTLINKKGLKENFSYINNIESINTLEELYQVIKKDETLTSINLVENTIKLKKDENILLNYIIKLIAIEVYKTTGRDILLEIQEDFKKLNMVSLRKSKNNSENLKNKSGVI